ncbi:hypothetical protein ABID21_004294 [Pseudorhizobium tarimense]|uniref:Uncharacterized protein n=1 Tax=Pseudorhizobium tarimense TaxID=1079109 RepID=A0ABV2HCA2_9HYPH|nr:DUF1217 domain-containing protein [Pseudorhizobium tarimense]
MTIKNVPKSDLLDPKSYFHQLKDGRFVTLAQAFNFTADWGGEDTGSGTVGRNDARYRPDYIVG